MRREATNQMKKTHGHLKDSQTSYSFSYFEMNLTKFDKHWYDFDKQKRKSLKFFVDDVRKPLWFAVAPYTCSMINAWQSNVSSNVLNTNFLQIKPFAAYETPFSVI